MNCYPLAALALALFAAPIPAAEPAPPMPAAPTPSAPPASSPAARTLEDAAAVLDDLAAIPLRGIPPKLLADAQAVVIVPRVVKFGFVLGVRGGRGVALVRTKDGAWGDPAFVHLGGASVGFQAGIESTDVVLVFRTRKGLDRVLEGKEKLTLGADASVAAGPVGRAALAATDSLLSAEVLSYSRARGLFAGVAVDGAVIHIDAEANVAFRAARADEPKLAAQLRSKLAALAAPEPGPGARPTSAAPVLLPPVAPVGPRVRSFGMWRRWR
jgi:lipid-binding SYLF domain-containing protein